VGESCVWYAQKPSKGNSEVEEGWLNRVYGIALCE